jgi:hypothetical protein
MNSKRQGILISYLAGTPVGLITVFIVFTIPIMLTGEGLATMALIGVYGKAILGLLISFLVALGIGGHNATVDIENKKSLLKTSFKYSLTVNSIIWTVFVLLTIFNNEKSFWLILTLPIVAFILCTIITTFTLGLFICYMIKKRVTNATIFTVK